MRNDFLKQVMIEMERRPDLFFLTGDLGFHVLEPLQEKFGERFINAGVAEQNMMGLAAGLAMTGKQVIAYSIATFATMRCFEQIRDDLCYHNLNVKIVGIGGGFNYGYLGITHHAVEDIAIMRALPNMKVVCPAYGWEAAEATRALLADSGPVYLRLGRNLGIDFYRPAFSFALGKGFVIKEGHDIILISTSNILAVAAVAAKILEEKLSKSVAVISMPTVKPLDRQLILAIAESAEAIFTIEEHNIIGGLGSAVSEVLAASALPKKIFHAFGIPDKFIEAVGKREYLCSLAGLDADQISQAILAKLK
jgi:transketolase